MDSRLTPSGSKKRSAPGAAPGLPNQQIPQMQQLQRQNFVPQAQPWTTSDDINTSLYTDQSAYNMGTFGQTMSNGQYQLNNQGGPSTQLARRPLNNQLVTTAPRGFSDGMDDTWGQFGQEGLDPQEPVGEETDNIEVLEQRAQIAKKDAQSKRKQIPPFVQKLRSFLDESKNTDLIRWSDRGDSFVVLDEDEFAKKLIPELFKHNNYASFVRQLNMYGFHKKVGLSDNSMKASERKNKSPSEYSNTYFRRGHPNLLWLINKPKGGIGLKKGAKKGKQGDGDGGSDDEGDGVEATYSNEYGTYPMQNSRAISAVPEQSGPSTGPGTLQRKEMTVVQGQLQDIQKQQATISNAIARLRKDHNQLYQQALAFQNLHDRHESSINAILTFLATVYNRNMVDGQGPPLNMGQLFSNMGPQEQQRGNVVDMSDMNQPQQQTMQAQAGGVSPVRRAQRLLMAPPANGQQRSASPVTQSPYNSSPAIEELFETSPAESPRIKTESLDTNTDMLNLINNTNASVNAGQNGRSAQNLQNVLSHYETANGASPLTSAQRNDMLHLMASQASTSGTNNALISPIPPPQPNLEALTYKAKELNEMVRMQSEIESNLKDIVHTVQPLSPSGSIPGLAGLDDSSIPSSYFGNNLMDASLGNSNNDDLDQFLNSDAYADSGDVHFGNGDSGNVEFNFDNYNTADPNSFDFGMDGADDGGRIIEEANTPENGIKLDTDSPLTVNSDEGSSKKRRRV